MMKFLLVYAGTENLSKFAREKCENLWIKCVTL